MITFLYIVIGLVLGAGVVFFVLRSKQNDGEQARVQDTFILLQNQIEMLATRFENNIRALDGKLHESNRDVQTQVHRQFGESQKLIKEITDKVGEVREKVAEVKEANKQVFTIAEQLQNLEKVLKHQKQRGNLGEASLELILSNVLPPSSYTMQYQFDNGETVDAVVRTASGLLPVDAKFSLDNYNRVINEKDDERKAELEKVFHADLKKRIDETAKYVRPEEGTLPLAFMFIPAEGIYYDLLVNEVASGKASARDLVDYAINEKKVIIVSPTTFSAYLQSVLYGLKAFTIESKAAEITKRVGELGKHLAAYDEYVKKLGNSLSTTVNHYNSAYKELKKVDKDVTKIAGDGAQIEPIALEKPIFED